MRYSDIHSYLTHLHKKQEDLLEQVKDIQVEIEIIKEQKNVYVGEDGYLYFENVNFNEEITNVDFKIKETSENNVYLKFCETWERAGTLVDIYIRNYPPVKSY